MGMRLGYPQLSLGVQHPGERRFASYGLFATVTEASFASPAGLWAENPCAASVGTVAAIDIGSRSDPAGTEQ
jgi:hypothetical protein